MHSWKAVGEFSLLARDHGLIEVVREDAGQFPVVARRPAPREAKLLKRWSTK